MNYYPAFLNLHSKLVLLVGGGRVAARKLASLLAAGARVCIVSPNLANETIAQLSHPRVKFLCKKFDPADLKEAWLVICATNDSSLNQSVAKAAENAKVFANIVDTPSLCNFIVPASFTRGELIIAISTSGISPAIARYLRERLETEFGPEWEPFLHLMHILRNLIIAQGQSNEEIYNLFHALANSDLLIRIAKRDYNGIDKILLQLLGPNYTLANLGWNFQSLNSKQESGQ